MSYGRSEKRVGEAIVTIRQKHTQGKLEASVGDLEHNRGCFYRQSAFLLDQRNGAARRRQRSTLDLLIKTASDSFAAGIGSNGTSIFLRVSSFILLCVGGQIFWNSVSSLLGALIHSWRIPMIQNRFAYHRRPLGKAKQSCS